MAPRTLGGQTPYGVGGLTGMTTGVRGQLPRAPVELHLYGSRQSTGWAPWRTRRSLTRLNGREPKKPRSADMGEG